MSSYYNENGGYGNQGYGGYGRPQHHRINEEDVPESKHTLFIRGLPGNMPTEEVKEYFDSRIGPCSFDFQKVSPDRSRLFVAVRFESREHAKECMNKYKDADILGYPCELTWFRDIRRFASYQAAQQGGRGGVAALANRRGRGVYRNNSGGYNRSYYDRKRRRSESGESSRSRSRSRSGSDSSRRSRSLTHGSSSRDSDRSFRRVSSHDDRSDSEPRRIKKEKKQKKSKKEKKRRSMTPESGSEGELRSHSGRRSVPHKSRSASREKLVVQRDRSESPLHVNNIKAASNDKDIKISITMPPLPPNPPPIQASNKELQNTTISFGLEGDQPPKRIVKKQDSPISMEIENDTQETDLLRAPTSNQIIKGNPRFKPIEEENDHSSPPPPPPPSSTNPSSIPIPQYTNTANSKIRDASIPFPPKPQPQSSSHSISISQSTQSLHDSIQSSPQTPVVTKRNENQNNSSPIFQPRQLQQQPKRISELKTEMKEDKFPFTTKLLEGIKEYQILIVEQIKYEPPEDEESGTLKLSSLSTLTDENDDDLEMKALDREQKLLSLNSLQMDKVELKKKQLEKAFKGDCETFKIVTLKLLSKDGDLEKSLRLAMMQVIEDLEKQMIEKLDAFLAQL